MNRKVSVLTGSAAAVLAAVLVACGGAGSSDSAATATTLGSTTPSTGATSPGVTASGMVTAFGSVFVNGREFEVNNSTTVLDGDADDATSTPATLKVGMNVDVTASGSNATLVRFTSAVRGEVDAIDTTASTLTVLGQKVVISSGTAFAGSKGTGATTSAVSALSSVSVGDYVIVYGYQSCATSTSTTACTGNTTQVLASLVYEPGATGVYRTVGYALGVSGSTFQINGLTVAYTATGTAPTNCKPAPCSVAVGDYVEVRAGTAPVSSAGALTLAAALIRTASTRPVLITGETVSIEGPVGNVSTSANTFTVRGIGVDGSALASTVAALTANEIVAVTGTVSPINTLTATAVTVEKQAAFTLVGPLTAESASGDTLQVLGQTFAVNSATRFDDDSQNVRPFNLSNFATVLSAGDQLVVSGYAGTAGSIATRVVRIRAPAMATVALEGVVTAVSTAGDTVTVGGVTVTLSSATSLQYPGAGKTPSLTTFVDDIVVGSTVVLVQGTPGATAGSVTATFAGMLAPHCGWAGNF